MPSIKSEDGMRAVELHRAESMVQTPPEQKPVAPGDVHAYVVSTLDSFLWEIRQCKIEVVMFLYMFSYVMRSVTSTTMLMDKACLVHLNFSEEVCNNLKDYPEAKSRVEVMANNYHLGHTLIQMVPAAIISTFIGAWSDRYGRKPPVILALVGIIVDGLGSSVCAYYFRSRIEYYYIPAAFTGLSGGFISVLTVLYSYTSDVTGYGRRTMKYAVMEMTFGMAMPLGQMAGGWLFKWSGYVPVFLMSTGGHLAALAWVLFVLSETIVSADPWRTKMSNFFATGPVKEGIKATFRKRPNKGRQQILMLILAMSFAVLAFASTSGIAFFYVHHLYDWDNTHYSTVVAVFSVVGTVAMLVAVAVFKRLGLGDVTLGLVGSVSMLVRMVGIGLAVKQELFYLVNLLGLLSSLSTLAGRSRISKVTSKEDLGKVFSFLTSAESILPILSTAFVTQVFNASLDFYPGLIFLIMGGMLIVPVLVFIWLARIPQVDYEAMQNQTEAEAVEPSEKETKDDKL